MTPTDTVAVILAAGAGSRLGELGRECSKPMVPVAGRPLIDWVIAQLHAAGADHIIVVGHPSDIALATFLRDHHPGSRLVLQPERRGIADALRQALPLIDVDAAFVACACDSLFAADDVRALIACGRLHAPTAVVGVLEMGAAATVSRSAVRLDGARVIEIVEKPRPGTVPSGLVAMPLYWLRRSFAPHLDAAPVLGGERYISTALNAFVKAGGSVRAVSMSERVEVTTADDVARAESWLRKR